MKKLAFTIRWALWSLAWVCVVNVGHAELPKKLQEDLTQAKADLEKRYMEAQETLLAAFDKKITQTRGLPKLNATEKQNLIADIETEKAVFEKLGFIPFSPNMRSDAIAYLNKVQRAEIDLARIYDRAIDDQTKKKADDMARGLLAEKNAAIERRLIARWSVTDVNGKNTFNWTLYSNGTMPGGSWVLDQQHLVLRHPDKKAPAGAWIDTCTIRGSGRALDATNNNNTKFTGKLIIESK